MSFLNLMGDSLKPKEVNDALESIIASQSSEPVPAPVSNIEKIEVTASTNASGKITISNTSVPLDKLISVIIKSPTGSNNMVYRGSQSYGVIVTEQGTLTPVASTECVLEITKFK